MADLVKLSASGHAGRLHEKALPAAALKMTVITFLLSTHPQIAAMPRWPAPPFASIAKTFL
ncbi:MAG: hypothetical protein QM302_08005 [Acidobacteriota bacterium]|nr:hypothetical protein [Acidobacteriota bacterium]